jgi:hypothetical protein
MIYEKAVDEIDDENKTLKTARGHDLYSPVLFSA